MSVALQGARCCHHAHRHATCDDVARIPPSGAFTSAHDSPLTRPMTHLTPPSGSKSPREPGGRSSVSPDASGERNRRHGGSPGSRPDASGVRREREKREPPEMPSRQRGARPGTSSSMTSTTSHDSAGGTLPSRRRSTLLRWPLIVSAYCPSPDADTTAAFAIAPAATEKLLRNNVVAMVELGSVVVFAMPRSPGPIVSAAAIQPGSKLPIPGALSPTTPAAVGSDANRAQDRAGIEQTGLGSAARPG